MSEFGTVGENTEPTGTIRRFYLLANELPVTA